MLPALREPLPEIHVGPAIFVRVTGCSRPCMAAMCDVPAVAHAICLSADWTRLEWPEVCAGHADLLRGSAIILPLDTVPHESVLVPAVEAEIARRQQVRQQQVQWMQQRFTFTTTTGFVNNPAGGFYVQWG